MSGSGVDVDKIKAQKKAVTMLVMKPKIKDAVQGKGRVTRHALTGYAASVLKKGGSDAIKTLLHGLHPLLPFWLHGGIGVPVQVLEAITAGYSVDEIVDLVVEEIVDAIDENPEYPDVPNWKKLWRDIRDEMDVVSDSGSIAPTGPAPPASPAAAPPAVAAVPPPSPSTTAPTKAASAAAAPSSSSSPSSTGTNASATRACVKSLQGHANGLRKSNAQVSTTLALLKQKRGEVDELERRLFKELESVGHGTEAVYTASVNTARAAEKEG